MVALGVLGGRVAGWWGGRYFESAKFYRTATEMVSWLEVWMPLGIKVV